MNTNMGNIKTQIWGGERVTVGGVIYGDVAKTNKRYTPNKSRTPFVAPFKKWVIGSWEVMTKRIVT